MGRTLFVEARLLRGRLREANHGFQTWRLGKEACLVSAFRGRMRLLAPSALTLSQPLTPILNLASVVEGSNLKGTRNACSREMFCDSSRQGSILQRADEQRP